MNIMENKIAGLKAQCEAFAVFVKTGNYPANADHLNFVREHSGKSYDEVAAIVDKKIVSVALGIHIE